MTYAIVIEPSETGFGAYALDLPGCVAAGETEDETRTLIREAIRLHLEALQEAGEPIPEPSSRVEYVDVGTAA